jgi:hypothetical protein
VVSPDAFQLTLAREAPPRDLAPPLAALWWARKGEWDKAHRIVQDETDAEAGWVHAYLHRVEGDRGNAGYWYRRAGRHAAAGDFDAEWTSIVGALLRAGAEPGT